LVIHIPLLWFELSVLKNKLRQVYYSRICTFEFVHEVFWVLLILLLVVVDKVEDYGEH
jgi:hypothetical protein